MTICCALLIGLHTVLAALMAACFGLAVYVDKPEWGFLVAALANLAAALIYVLPLRRKA